MNFRYKTSRRN